MKSILNYLQESQNFLVKGNKIPNQTNNVMSEDEILKAGNAFYVRDNGEWIVVLDGKLCYLSEYEPESEEGAIAIGLLVNDYAEKHSESLLNDLKKAIDRYIPKKWLDSSLVVWDKEEPVSNSKAKYELIKKFD